MRPLAVLSSANQSCFLFVWIFIISFCGSARRSHAASGTWINGGGGSWTNNANWSGGTVADGAGSVANFNTLSLSADRTVTLDASRTIGNLNFDDQNSTKHNWLLSPGGPYTLTLAGTTPTITVGSATTTIDAIVAGTVGLTKVGAGKLALGGGNTYTGTTTINAGKLAIGSANFPVSSPLNIASPANCESSGTINLIVNSSGTAFDITGSGILRLVSATNNASAPDIYFGPNHSANSFWGARLAAPLDLGGSQRFIYGKTGHNGVGQYGLTNADCQFAGTISGAGGLTIIAQNNWTGSGPMETGFALNASNSFTGPLEIQRGSVYLGNPGAFNHGNLLTFNSAAGNNARFFLYGQNAIVTDLSSVGAGNAVIANGNRKTGAALTLGAVTLTVTQNNSRSFGGTITDVFSEYDGSGSGTTGPLNLLKNGPATLILTGANTYTGTTTVSSGALQVDGSLTASPVTVQSGSTLAGTGVLGGPINVQAGGLLAPGGNGIGALTINNSLTLSGSVLMEVSKTGNNPANDQVAGIGSLTFGGALMVTNVGGGTLAAGDSVTLFSARAYTASFSSMTLPALGAGLS